MIDTNDIEIKTEMEYNDAMISIIANHKKVCQHGRPQKKRTCKSIDQGFLCDILMDYMTESISHNYIISESNLINFYGLVIQKSYGVSSSKHCFYVNNQRIIDLTISILKHQLVSLNIFELLLKNAKFDSYLHNITANKDFAKCSDPYFRLIITTRFKYTNGIKDTILWDFVKDNINITPYNLAELCKCPHMCISEKVSQIIDSFDDKVFTKNIIEEYKLMKNACNNLPYATCIITSLFNKNITIDNDIFATICEHGSYNTMKYILELTRIPVTSSHFKAVLKTPRRAYNIKNIYREYSESESEELSESEEFTELPELKKRDNTYETKTPKKNIFEGNKMELLFLNGFIPNREDIKQSIVQNIKIDNMERFDHIIFDKEMYEYCVAHNFYPNYKFNCISQEMVSLQLACNEKDLPRIKNLIKLHKLIPDNVCMENISKYRESTIFSYLIKMGGKVNLQCVKNVAKSYPTHKFMSQYLNEYEKEKDNEIEQYKKKIMELETIVNKNNNNDKDNSDPEQCNDFKYNILQLNMTDDDITNYKQKYKNKRNPHIKIVELFGIDNKHKTSYSEFKKLLFDKIRTESWLSEHDKTLIKVPQKYKLSFGLNDNENDMVRFEDVDKLICLFYATNC